MDLKNDAVLETLNFWSEKAIVSSNLSNIPSEISLKECCESERESRSSTPDIPSLIPYPIYTPSSTAVSIDSVAEDILNGHLGVILVYMNIHGVGALSNESDVYNTIKQYAREDMESLKILLKRTEFFLVSSSGKIYFANHHCTIIPGILFIAALLASTHVRKVVFQLYSLIRLVSLFIGTDKIQFHQVIDATVLAKVLGLVPFRSTLSIADVCGKLSPDVIKNLKDALLNDSSPISHASHSQGASPAEFKMSEEDIRGSASSISSSGKSASAECFLHLHSLWMYIRDYLDPEWRLMAIKYRNKLYLSHTDTDCTPQLSYAMPHSIFSPIETQDEQMDLQRLCPIILDSMVVGISAMMAHHGLILDILEIKISRGLLVNRINDLINILLTWCKKSSSSFLLSENSLHISLSDAHTQWRLLCQRLGTMGDLEIPELVSLKNEIKDVTIIPVMKQEVRDVLEAFCETVIYLKKYRDCLLSIAKNGDNILIEAPGANKDSQPSLENILLVFHPTWSLYGNITGRIYAKGSNIQTLPKKSHHIIPLTKHILFWWREDPTLPPQSLQNISGSPHEEFSSMLEYSTLNEITGFDTLLPRGVIRQLRDIYISPKDCQFISYDFNQVELRLLAHWSRDPQLIQDFRDEKDVLTEIAKIALGIHTLDQEMEPYLNTVRSKIKIIVYGFIYGMGLRKMQELINNIPYSCLVDSTFDSHLPLPLNSNSCVESEDLGIKNPSDENEDEIFQEEISEEEEEDNVEQISDPQRSVKKDLEGKIKARLSSAKKLISIFFRRYPEARKFCVTIRRHACNDFLSVSLLREWHLRNEEFLKEADRRRRTGLAILLQGSAAELLKFAMAEIHDSRHQIIPGISCAPFAFVMTLHDEIIITAPSPFADRVTKFIHQIMISLGEKLNLRVPLKVSIRTGKSLGNLVSIP